MILNEARFSLLLDPRKNAAELLAECGLCGAMATQPLDMAWSAGHVAYPECRVQAKRGYASEAVRRLPMKTAFAVGVGLLLVAMSGSATEGKSAAVFINGFGQDPCGKYVEAYRQGQNGYAPYISFVQGYATAMSVDTAAAEGRTVDYTGGTSIEAMALWLNIYCTQHPLVPFAVATDALLAKTSGMPSKLPQKKE